MRRRALLATTAASLATLAGCGTDGTGGESRGTEAGGTPTANDGKGSMGTSTPTPAGDGEPLSEATIATDLSTQPHLGPDPMEAESVIVDVSDPSCPTCESHHSGAFSRIRSELVESGSTAYVVRNVDWIYDWSTDACRALEATYAHAPDAYWGLLDFFFDNQQSISMDDVLEEAEGFLADEGVDASAVIEAVESGRPDDAISTDDSVARAAGVEGVPTFFLFRDRRLRTSFAGPQNYGVFERALGY